MSSINFKQPDEAERKAMSDYADLCSQALNMIMKYEVGLATQAASMRLNESMFWFHSFILNGGKLKPEIKMPSEEQATENPSTPTIN